ncbi:MAG TPA: enoyl-CoA hydratase/isomerase family protein [Gemmatimonadales bacterium]|jgi:2-(1,2-epoxy-1,2-dihydrophenyl)acetyl-CoA isomerase|nr:enoyl-CoA hydratase/isomerase family protein [Gemmatimonadales bacterium]
MAADLVSRADGPAWRITIDRPARRNALTPELAGALADEISRVTTGGSACAVLLEGGGGHFSAGLDLRWLASLGATPPSSEIRAGLARFQAAILAIVRAPVPVVALVRGSAAGFGVDLAVAADVRLAGTSASFTSAFARMGLVPDGGSTYGLPRLIGDGAALRFLLTGEVVSADAALRIGLVDEVVDDGALDARAGELTRALAGAAAGSVASIKRLCRADEIAGLERALRAEAEAQVEAFAGPEFQRRLMAFLSRGSETRESA